MATLTVDPEVAVIELDTQGLDSPQMVRAIPPGSSALDFSTAGSFNRAIRITPTPVDLILDTSSGSSEFVRKELMAGAGIELQIWDRDDPQGTLIEVLQFLGQKFELAISQTGSIEILLPARYLNSALAEKDHHIVVLVDGIERARYIAEDLVEIAVDEKEVQSVKVIGRGIGAILEWGAIAPYDFEGPNQRVKRAWSSETRAGALYELFNEIQGRGILTNVIADGWNGVYDSSGNPWPDLIDLEFDAGGSFLGLLDNWTEYGIEWLMSWDFRLQLSNSFGRALADSVVLYPAHTVRHQELSISRRDIKTIVLAQDGTGGVQKIYDAGARTQWGDREQYVVFGDALGAGTASSNGYLLLDLVKDAIKERRVEIDPNAPGRRPFVDFDLGDVVGVWFGDDVYEFRVLAIAMASDESGNMRCEVTLEYMLEAMRRRRQRLLNASTAGGGVSSSPQTVYATGGGFVVGTDKSPILPLALKAFLSTAGKLGYSLIGNCSVAMTIRIEVMYSETVLETFEYTVSAGMQTIEITWLWTQIPPGEVPMRLQVWTSSGTFTVGSGKAQFWVEAKGIAGKQASVPILFVTESIEVSSIVVDPFLDTVESFPTATAIQFSGSESIPEPTLQTMSDGVDYTETPMFIFPSRPIVGEDGWAGASSFTSSGTTTPVGNNGTESRDAWFRFDIPVDLTGREIRDAYLIGVTNSASGSVDALIRAVDSDAPLAPTNRTDYDSLSFVSPSRGWTLTPTAGGTFRSPSILNIVENLQTTYGTMTSMVIVVEDSASSSNRIADFRSAEYGSGAGMKLVIEYLEY